MNKPLTIGALILLFVSLISAFDQPNMIAARNDLNKADTSLKKASSDKGGHRNNAMNLVSRAINAVNDGIAYDRTHLTPGKRGRRNSDIADTTLAAPSDQPNMEAARNHLQRALNNLQRASADKGGHRERAIDLVRQAITEVNRGIAYDRNNND